MSSVPADAGALCLFLRNNAPVFIHLPIDGGGFHDIGQGVDQTALYPGGICRMVDPGAAGSDLNTEVASKIRQKMEGVAQIGLSGGYHGVVTFHLVEENWNLGCMALRALVVGVVRNPVVDSASVDRSEETKIAGETG